MIPVTNPPKRESAAKTISDRTMALLAMSTSHESLVR